MAFRVAVLVSGEGTNLQALLDGVHGRDGIEIVAVASNRAEARGLERARRAGVETGVFPRPPEGDRDARDRDRDARDRDRDARDRHARDRDARDRALGDWLEQRGVDLVVLAGFMEILGAPFIRRFRGRIVNVHPSLLPAFPGTRAIADALDHGVKVLGVTVHFVDEGVDTGPIVMQEAIDCPYPRDIAEVEKRVHDVEHRLLPRAVRLIAQGRVRIDGDNPRLVLIDDGED